MASFNKITIVGFLGKDVETRYLPDGTAVANFTIATSEKVKRNGEAQEQTTWFKVNAFGKLAEICAQYLSKGSQAYVDGRLSAQQFTDRDGNIRTSLEVRASEVVFLDRKPQGDTRPTDELDGARQHTQRQQSRFEPAGPDVGDGMSVPF